MSVRSVIVRLEANVAQYTAGMGRAGAATDSVARQVVNTRRNIAENEQAMKDLGGSFLKAGAIGVAALGATAKAAMDWESAWAGVTKTVDGTPAQLAQLEDGLRSLAKTLPASHTEIAGVAEAAGQLGVARKDVIGFTKTMIDLGVSTNLTAEDAATNIAQISNVMGTMAREGSEGVARFGAALVALGNDGASTEAEILAMAQRIAGAAATVGASETDVLALANTLASMGVKAELGGGVTTRVLLKMYAAVQDGGDKLEAFAKTAGVSMDDFSKAFRESPVEAMDMVNKGLSRVKEEGGNVVATMKDMGIKGTEEMQVMLSLAASGDLLSESLALGAKSWEENTALIEEAGKRYDTTSSKISIAWNQIKDAAIDAGAVILPVISGITTVVGGLATGFGELPGPAQSTIVILAGVATGALLLGGTLLTVIPKIAATRLAMQTLNTSGSRIPATMGKVAKGVGIAAGALLILTAAAKIGNAIWGEGALDVEAFGQALVNTGGSMSAMDNLFADAENGIKGVGDAMIRFNDMSGFDKVWSGWLDFLGMDDSVTRLRDSLGSLDSKMAEMASAGDTEKVGAQFASLAKEAQRSAEEQGKTVPTIDELLDLMPEYKASLQAVATAAGVTLDGQELLNFALGKTPAALTAATTGAEAMAKGVEATGVALDGVIESMDKFLEQLFASGMLTMSARDANAAYHDSIRGVDAAIKTINESAGAMGRVLNDNATDFDLTTEAGSAANAAFQDLARSGMAEVEALSKEGVGQDELQVKLTQTGVDLGIAAGKLGITGDAADTLTRKVLGVPDGVSIESWMDSQAKKIAEDTKAAVDNIPASKTVTLYGNVDPSFRNAALEAYRLGQIKTAPGMNINTETSGVGGGYADGGAVYGPGTGTSDSITARLSNNEHVLTAREVQMMGGHDQVYRFRAAVRNGDIPAYAGGGAVGAVMAPARQLMSLSGSSDLSSEALDRLTDAVKSARAVNYNARDTSRGAFKDFVREMEGS